MSVSLAPLRRQHRFFELLSDLIDTTDEVDLNRDLLKSRAKWIRDDLDPQVAINGPNALTSDTVVTLYQFLENLRHAHLELDDIR